MTISHVWPGITPLNVWEMTYDFWLQFSLAAAEEQRKAKDGG